VLHFKLETAGDFVSKGMDSKKTEKKPPVKTMKEKKAAKKEKSDISWARPCADDLMRLSVAFTCPGD
jgi:hypothetical protein